MRLDLNLSPAITMVYVQRGFAPYNTIPIQVGAYVHLASLPRILAGKVAWRD